MELLVFKMYTMDQQGDHYQQIQDKLSTLKLTLRLSRMNLQVKLNNLDKYFSTTPKASTKIVTHQF